MTAITVRRGSMELLLRRRSEAILVFGARSGVHAQLGGDDRVEAVRRLSENVLMVRARNESGSRSLSAELSDHVPVTGWYEFDDPEVSLPFLPTSRLSLGTVDGRPPQQHGLGRLLDQLGLRAISSPVAGGYFRFSTTAKVDAVIACAALTSQAGVLFAEPDRLVSLLHAGEPEWVARQWHLEARPIVGGLAGFGANIREAWAITRGDPEVVVGVFDDGFDLMNPDLMGNRLTSADFAPLAELLDLPEPFGPADEDASANRMIGDYHGTPCAGLAIGRASKNVSGVAPGCAWLPGRARFSLASEDLLLRSIEYLSARCDVLSCSWGALASPYEVPSMAMLQTFDKLVTTGGRRGRGLVVCFAAGNKNLPTVIEASANPSGFEFFDNTGRKTGTFFQNKPMHSAWSEIPETVVVGAINFERKKSRYSNWGSTLTVVAPSDDWDPSQAPAERAMSKPKLVTSDNEHVGLGMFELGAAPAELGYVTDSMSGTSGATPIVAGACALVVSVSQGITAGQVLQILRDSADKTGLPPKLDAPVPHNNNQVTGAFDAATGHSAWYGYGALDVHKAVAMARG